MVKSNKSDNSRLYAVANQPIFETMKTKRGDSVETFIVFGRDESVILNGFAAKHHQFTIIVIDDGSSIDFIRDNVTGSILRIHRGLGDDRLADKSVECTNVSIGRPRNVHALSISVVTSSLYDYLDSIGVMCQYISYIRGYTLVREISRFNRHI
uniref:Uncharacterized protein n=1 Tax=Lutzomyia longipalpis TaxID=7200 RepID=A0A1B0CL58_LUTLO